MRGQRKDGAKTVEPQASSALALLCGSPRLLSSRFHKNDGVLVPGLAGRKLRIGIVVERAVQFGLGQEFGLLAHGLGKESIFFDVQSAAGWVQAESAD